MAPQSRGRTRGIFGAFTGRVYLVLHFTLEDFVRSRGGGDIWQRLGEVFCPLPPPTAEETFYGRSSRQEIVGDVRGF